MIRNLALALVALSFSPSLAMATSFSVLLGEPPDPNADVIAMENPLAKESGWQDAPQLESIIISVDPQDVWPGIPAILTMAIGDSLPSDLPRAPTGALVFEISLHDAATGNAIHQLPDPLNIWFTGQSPPGTPYAFGTLNEATGTWEQMAVIKKDRDGLLCGTTEHLSYFYLASVPEPSTWLLAALGAAGVGLAARRRRFPNADPLH